MTIYRAVAMLQNTYGRSPWFRTAGVCDAGRDRPTIVLWCDRSAAVPAELGSGSWLGYPLEIVVIPPRPTPGERVRRVPTSLRRRRAISALARAPRPEDRAP